MLNTAQRVTKASGGHSAMWSGAVIRVGRLLEATLRGEPHGFKPEDAVRAINALKDNAHNFDKAAHQAIKGYGAEVVTGDELTRILGASVLDEAERARTLMPIFAFEEILVKVRVKGVVRYVRVQVAVTVCEWLGLKIARSKAWVRCKPIIDAAEAEPSLEELRSFSEIAESLALAIIEHQRVVYEEALKLVLENDDDRAHFHVSVSNDVFRILGLPTENLDNFRQLFDDVLDRKPLRALAQTQGGSQQDAKALWELLGLFADMPSPAHLLEQPAELKKLSEEPRKLEILPFESSDEHRGLFLWRYDRPRARVDAVGYAAPPPRESASKKVGDASPYGRAVAAVTASLSADLGSSL
ncbi:MAG: hypothetical protein WAU68_11750 [Vitreimonas sp.]